MSDLGGISVPAIRGGMVPIELVDAIQFHARTPESYLTLRDACFPTQANRAVQAQVADYLRDLAVAAEADRERRFI